MNGLRLVALHAQPADVETTICPDALAESAFRLSGEIE
jgi:hypothetical protein